MGIYDNYSCDGQLNIFDYVRKPFKIDKLIRLIELFGGISSQAMALKRLGVKFEHYRLVEFDPNPVKTGNAIHGTDFEPTDITKIKGDDLGIVDTENYCYILTYSFPCGLAGTKIKVIDGYKNIEDITDSDLVLTHTNTYKRVVKTMSRKSPSYNIIKILGQPQLKLTDEHPMYVLRDGKIQWVKVKDLKNTDMACMNINTKSDDANYSNEILWLLGRYVADGHISKYAYNSVNFSIGVKKADEFKKHIPGLVDRFKFFEKKGCFDYRIADKDLQDLCIQFGNGAEHKHIPEWILNLPIEKTRVFLDGYFSGDGHLRMHGKRLQMMFSTVSKELFLGIQQMVLKTYGVVCSCYIRKDGRKETYRDTYNGQFPYDGISKFQTKIGDQMFIPIREVKHIDEQVMVYNFEVEKDNSYTCENIVVHNCQDLSIAGKMKGMSKDSGTRSGLLWEVERLLNECKELPQVLLMENVPQVHSEQNMPDFQMWLKFLESKGYCNYWQDLNARDYGVPQNRKRCFCVSLLGEFNYKFPAPIPLKVYADELLEPIVSDKYKIGGKRAKELLDKLIMDEEALSRAEQSRAEQSRAEQIGYIPGSLTYTKRVHPISESLIALQQGKEEYQTTYKSQKEHCEVIAFCDQRYDEGLRVRNEMICPCITLHSASQTFNTSCPYVLERHEKDIH